MAGLDMTDGYKCENCHVSARELLFLASLFFAPLSLTRQARNEPFWGKLNFVKKRFSQTVDV